mgnify:CR=1 FL=1
MGNLLVTIFINQQVVNIVQPRGMYTFRRGGNNLHVVYMTVTFFYIFMFAGVCFATYYVNLGKV